jgi:hypothetical protein
MGPAVVDTSASCSLVAEGVYVRPVSTWEDGRQRSVTDWAAPRLDGDMSLDVSIDIEPVDLSWAKLQLDTRRNPSSESTPPTPRRTVALEQISDKAYERRKTLPMRMTATLVVRGAPIVGLERRTKRPGQRVKDLGAELRLLRWEQRVGWLAVVPFRRPASPSGVVSQSRQARPVFWPARWRSRAGVPLIMTVTFTTAAPRSEESAHVLAKWTPGCPFS